MTPKGWEKIEKEFDKKFKNHIFKVVDHSKDKYIGDYEKIYANNYFWRTWEGKEIDWIEEREGKLFGYEIKWSKNKIKPPAEWLTAYREAEFKVINKDNYLDFIA